MDVGGGVILPCFIKSHQRVQQFFDHTYTQVLGYHGCLEHPEHIHVFVSTNDDQENYKSAYPLLQIHQGPLGVRHIDNFMTTFAARHGVQEYVYMNDDLLGVFKTTKSGKAKRLKEEKLSALVWKMLRAMRKSGATYGGLYPSEAHAHTAASRERWSEGLCCIMDNFSLVRCPRTHTGHGVEVTCSDKSDFEKVIQHFAVAGSLLRANRYFVKKLNYETEGGFEGERTSATELDTARYVASKYPHFVSYVKVNKHTKFQGTSLQMKPFRPGAVPPLGRYAWPYSASIPLTVEVHGCPNVRLNKAYRFWNFSSGGHPVYVGKSTSSILKYCRKAWRICRTSPVKSSKTGKPKQKTLALCKPGRTSRFFEGLQLPAPKLAFEERDSTWKVRVDRSKHLSRCTSMIVVRKDDFHMKRKHWEVMHEAPLRR